jgi:7-keto-8-aminopelargonate synthetase-like enzyme
MNTASVNEELVARLREFIEMEARSGSMEPSLITVEYVYRMWGGAVELNDIEECMASSEFVS